MIAADVKLEEQPLVNLFIVAVVFSTHNPTAVPTRTVSTPSMPRGPGVREIFSSQSMGKKGVDSQESKLQKELSTPDNNGQPQMKKFGGYKPKILGGEVDFLQIQDTKPTAALTSLDSSNVEPQQSTLGMKPQPVSQKPWVIGDKNVPMVLGTTNDEDDDDGGDYSVDSNSNAEHQNIDSSIYNSIHSDDYNSDIVNGSSISLSTTSDTSDLLRQNAHEFTQGITNPLLYANDNNPLREPVTTTVPPETVTDFRDYRINEVPPDIYVAEEPAGVFIPAPDYDEEEKTLNFSEDTDDHSDGGDGGKPRQMKAKAPVKVYEGADLSHYLSEDEVEQDAVFQSGLKAKNVLDKKSKTGTKKSKNMFKQNTSSKNKRKSIGNIPTNNSVRSFSYADSKFGTKGKTMTKSLSTSNITDESEIFLSVNSEQSSYESFLRSRHGDHLPYEAKNDTGGGNNGDAGQSGNLKDKDDNVWKKLTMRLKHRVSKSLGAKDQ